MRRGLPDSLASSLMMAGGHPGPDFNKRAALTLGLGLGIIYFIFKMSLIHFRSLDALWGIKSCVSGPHLSISTEKQVNKQKD